jgi:hypothetical protein
VIRCAPSAISSMRVPVGSAADVSDLLRVPWRAFEERDTVEASRPEAITGAGSCLTRRRLRPFGRPVPGDRRRIRGRSGGQAGPRRRCPNGRRAGRPCGCAERPRIAGDPGFPVRDPPGVVQCRSRVVACATSRRSSCLSFAACGSSRDDDRQADSKGRVAGRKPLPLRVPYFRGRRALPAVAGSRAASFPSDAVVRRGSHPPRPAALPSRAPATCRAPSSAGRPAAASPRSSTFLPHSVQRKNP